MDQPDLKEVFRRLGEIKTYYKCFKCQGFIGTDASKSGERWQDFTFRNNLETSLLELGHNNCKRGS